MVRPVILAVGAIPVFFAILIALSMVLKPDIPTSAVVPEDDISLEYTKHDLRVVSFGVTERAAPQYTEILSIDNDGDVRYTVVDQGDPQPDITTTISKDRVRKLTAMIKETGFMSIPTESFPVNDTVDQYTKSSIKVTLNGQTRQIHWPEQNATGSFIPPIITMVQTELDDVIEQVK